MHTYHLHINGIVQGVGFRPMVYRLAQKMQVNGTVKNGSDGVHIFFNASEEIANSFFNEIMENAPAQARIISSEMIRTTDKIFNDFIIVVEDDDSFEKQVLLSPDIAICEGCKSELHDIDCRRYRYPFITCTQCGPRYSVIDRLPYERHSTSMKSFSTCSSCGEEYNKVTDRRFFSQTNSCAACGVELCLYEDALSIVSNDSQRVLSAIKNLLQQGKTIAVKGIGGYLLLCRADNAAIIQRLRNRKHRPFKPFAVLYPDMEAVTKDFTLNNMERALLESKEAPIVLLHPKHEAYDNLALKDITPGLNRSGIMLPYTPLLELIATDYGNPLVATSANISGSPIIYKDEDALQYLFDIADYVVTSNRDIVIPQDDSVVQVSKYFNRLIVLRRSRGFAPSFLSYKSNQKVCMLSTGAFLKSTFTLSINGNVFISQFLGTGESYESQQMFRDTLNHWLRLYNVIPGVIITDAHPQYFSHEYARELAEKYHSELKFIQHHEAHFAAVLAENNLIQTLEPVLGVIWDGTGLGSDGNIWGGEFFKYEKNEMQRCFHFDYFPAIAGDRMASEPRITALCASIDTDLPPDLLRRKFTAIEWNNYHSLIKTTSLFSSSAGRIFDAVACLLGLCDQQTYEGEAALRLQVLAEEYVEGNGFFMENSYFDGGAIHDRISTASLIQGIVIDIKRNKRKNFVAAKFYYSLVCLIGMVAKKTGVKQICFSGGVFQNSLLTDWIQKECSGMYHLYFNKNLSPNDENISFGQMVYHDNSISSTVKYRSGEINNQLIFNNHVFSNSR